MTYEQNTLDTPPAAQPVLDRPAHIPKKFWDAEQGELRTEALLKSYLDLEKRFTQLQAGQDEDCLSDDKKKAAMMKLLGRPDTPEDYEVMLDHRYFANDPELNQRLFDMGFTKVQAQAVYDLAAEKLVPMILDVMADIDAERELDAVIRDFGGPERWPEMARQLWAFGRKNLPADLLSHLASSAQGIHVLHDLMTRDDAVGGVPLGLGQGADDGGLARLQAMVRDPKYWRDHDPKIVDRVTKGFERVYGA